MKEIIAGIYEIDRDRELGSGGGGVVYLGTHTRLNKKVVLKADRRTLKTNMESLRREVDLLKNLSHRYIPQVYDFVQENGVVYTVMDYIEGESLDKPLKNGERFSQVDVIRWACQLLDALVYLHSVPPFGILHGDIKPANIILRRNGDICLIDYNIALALGEDGAVKVGYSKGYASPEHYGEDLQSENEKTVDRQALEKTELLSGGCEPTICISPGSSTPVVRRGSKIDQRSDIYCLGATLYHMISGKRPAQKAADVEKLGRDICSRQVADIIAKAMDPDPDKRFQTAEEMLRAFRLLPKNDARVKARRRRIVTGSVLIALAFIAGGIMSFIGLKQQEQRQKALALAEYSGDALKQGDVAEAISLALQAIPSGNSILEAPVTAEAQKALTDALGVYDLKDGFSAAGRIELPSEPFHTEISPDGTEIAAVYAYEAAVYELPEMKKMAVFPMIRSAGAEFHFLDEDRAVLAGSDGLLCCGIRNGECFWKAEPAGKIALDTNKTYVAAMTTERDGCRIYRVEDGSLCAEQSFEGKKTAAPVNEIFADFGNDLFAISTDGRFLAVSFEDGGVEIFDLVAPEDSMYLYEESDYRNFSGGFSGRYFAFSAESSAENLFALIDTEKAECISSFVSDKPIRVTAGQDRFLIANGGLLEELQIADLKEQEIIFTDHCNITGYALGEEYSAIAGDDNSCSFYNRAFSETFREDLEDPADFLMLSGMHSVIGSRSNPYLRTYRIERHEDACVAAYDPHCSHDEARLNADGSALMLFDYRSFTIFDTEGKRLCTKELPDPEHIYDQQFRKEKESYLEVIWYDGTVRKYSAEDGTLLGEEKKAKPEESLYEELRTEHYLVKSELHKPAVICDAATGNILKTLENEAHLTYFTETEKGAVAEYMTTDGRRYGYLLSASLEIVAVLPDLCDIRENTFLFDYHDGHLRSAPIYDLEELVRIGKEYQQAASDFSQPG